MSANIGNFAGCFRQSPKSSQDSTIYTTQAFYERVFERAESLGALDPAMRVLVVAGGVADRDALLARKYTRQWSRIGVLLGTEPSVTPVDLERLIAETAIIGRDEPRLFICAASWLAQYAEAVDGSRLATLLADLQPEASATAGAMLSIAEAATGAGHALREARQACRPLSPPRPLFRVVERSPSLSKVAAAETSPVLAVWGLFSDEDQVKPEAVRPTSWMRKHAPEIAGRLDHRIPTARGGSPAPRV